MFAGLFALKESAELLGLGVPEMLQLVQQVPAILGTPTFALQQNIQASHKTAQCNKHVLRQGPPLLMLSQAVADGCGATGSLVQSLQSTISTGFVQLQHSTI